MIRFNNYSFTSPVRFDRASFPGVAGIYAVMVIDPGARPLPYQVIYFGQTESFRDRFAWRHHAYGRWLRIAGREENLWVAFHLRPSSSERERQLLESTLIRSYQPPCNRAA